MLALILIEATFFCLRNHSRPANLRQRNRLPNVPEHCRTSFMPAKSRKKPTPDELLAEVKGKESAKTYEFEDYLEVVDQLVQKDYS